MDEAFSYFDKIFVINLDGDDGRLRGMSRRCAGLGIRFERYRAVQCCEMQRGSADAALRSGHFGCARSHQGLLREVWESGHERVLVLEDDAVFRDDSAAWLHRIIPQVATMPWDMFYLGSHVVRSAKTTEENVIRVLEGYHTHAYAVSRRAIPRLVQHIEYAIRIGRAFDGFEDSGLLKLCAVPILAIQEPNYSYTLGRYVDRRSQYFGPVDRADFEAHCAEMRHWIAPRY